MTPDEIRELGEDIDMYLHYIAGLIEENEEIGVEVVGQVAGFTEELKQLFFSLHQKSHVAKVP